MNKYLPALLTILALGTARADDPKPADVKPEPAKAVTEAGPLTNEQLETMLNDLALEPKDVSAKKDKEVLEVALTRDGWKIFVAVSQSTDKKNIWFDCKFNPLTEPQAASVDAWLNLLGSNFNETSPAFFTLDAKNRIHLSMAIENNGVTPVTLRKELEFFERIVRKTESKWKSANFKGAPKLEPLTDAGREALTILAGTWVLVEQEYNGQKMAAADVEASGIVYEFDGGKCRIKSKNSADIEAEVRCESGDGPLPLDLIFMAVKVMQRGVVKVEGDTMTICIANPDQPRPAGLDVPTDFKGMKMVLKRKV